MSDGQEEETQEEEEEEGAEDTGDDGTEGSETEQSTAAAPASEAVIEAKAEEPVATAAPVTIPAAVKPKADELKIVIIIKDNRATIGVQAPDCDPVFETAEGHLSEILAHSHIAVDNARAKWAVSKKNPKADIPTPPAPPPRPASTPSTSSKSSTATKTKAAAAAPKAQPKFF